MTPPTKAISLRRTCALEVAGLCKSTTFSSPCPKTSPIMGWFWDYVYQTACGYIGSYVWFLFQYTSNYSQDRCNPQTCVQVYPWGQALPFCWDQQCKHEMQLKKCSRIRYQTSCAMCGPGNFIHVLLWSLMERKESLPNQGLRTEKLPCNQVLTASPYYMKNTGIHLECPVLHRPWEKTGHVLKIRLLKSSVCITSYGIEVPLN